MNQNASHPEGQAPQGREHLQRIPRDQYESIRLRWPVRSSAGREIYEVFRTIYAANIATVVPPSPDVAYYQEQHMAAQRNLGANVVHAAATRPYDERPQYTQPVPEVQPMAPAAPVAEIAMGNSVVTTQDNLDYLAQEVNDAMAPVGATDIDIEAVRQQIREMA